MISVITKMTARLRERHLLRAHAWQSLANYTQQGFGLVFGIIMARMLTPADFGAFGFAAASVFLVLLPATWSLAPTLIPDAGKTPGLFSATAGFGWCVVFVRVGIVAVLCSWLIFRGDRQTAILCLILGIAESWKELNAVQRAYLESLGNFKANLVSAIFSVAVCIGLAIPLSLGGYGPLSLVAPIVGSVFVEFIVYYCSSPKSVFVRPFWGLDRHGFLKGIWLWLSSASEVTLSRLDSWYIGNFCGHSALGDYNRAFGYAPISHLLLNSLMTNPTLVGLTKCDSAKARRRLLIRTSSIVVGGGILNWIAFNFFARPIVLSVFGPKWENAIPLFQIFASLSLAYAASLLPIVLMLSARRYREIAIVRTTYLLIFVFILFLIPGTRSAESIAWLVQSIWLLQGGTLLFLSRSLLRDDPISHAVPCTT